MEIHKIYARGFGANAYALTIDNQKAIVIDPAQPRVLDEVEKLGLQVEYVLITHFHYDHVAGIPRLQEKGAKVLCSTLCKPFVGTNVDCSHMFGQPPVAYKVDDVFADGEEKTLCGIKIKCLITSGHTKGGACYMVTDETGKKLLFTGDTLFYKTVGRTDLPTGDVNELIESLRRLWALEDMPVYPGHGDDTTIAQEKAHNPYMVF